MTQEQHLPIVLRTSVRETCPLMPFESKLWPGIQTKSEEILKCHCWWLCLCAHSKHSVQPQASSKEKKGVFVAVLALSKMGRTEMSKNAFHRPQHYRHQKLAQKSLKLDHVLKKTSNETWIWQFHDCYSIVCGMNSIAISVKSARMTPGRWQCCANNWVLIKSEFWPSR